MEQSKEKQIYSKQICESLDFDVADLPFLMNSRPLSERVAQLRLAPADQ